MAKYLVKDGGVAVDQSRPLNIFAHYINKDNSSESAMQSLPDMLGTIDNPDHQNTKQMPNTITIDPMP